MEDSSRKADHTLRFLKHSAMGPSTASTLLPGVNTATVKRRISPRSVSGIIVRLLFALLTLSLFFEIFRFWNFAHGTPTRVTHVARRHNASEHDHVNYEDDVVTEDFGQRNTFSTTSASFVASSSMASSKTAFEVGKHKGKSTEHIKRGTQVETQSRDHVEPRSLESIYNDFQTMTTGTYPTTSGTSAPTSAPGKRNDERADAFGRQDELSKAQAGSQVASPVSHMNAKKSDPGAELNKRAKGKKGKSKSTASKTAVKAAAATKTSVLSASTKSTTMSKVSTKSVSGSSTATTLSSKTTSAAVPEAVVAASNGSAVASAPASPSSKPSFGKSVFEFAKQAAGGYGDHKAGTKTSGSEGAATNFGKAIHMAQKGYEQRKAEGKPLPFGLGGGASSGSSTPAANPDDVTPETVGTTNRIDETAGYPDVDSQSASGDVATSGQIGLASKAAGRAGTTDGTSAGAGTYDTAPGHNDPTSAGISGSGAAARDYATGDTAAGKGVGKSAIPVPNVSVDSSTGGTANSNTPVAAQRFPVDNAAGDITGTHQAASKQNVPVADTTDNIPNASPPGSAQSVPVSNPVGHQASSNGAKQAHDSSTGSSVGGTTNTNLVTSGHAINAARDTTNLNAGGTIASKSTGDAPVKQLPNSQISNSNGNRQLQRRWSISGLKDSMKDSMSNRANDIAAASKGVYQDANNAASLSDTAVAAKEQIDQARGYVGDILPAKSGSQAASTGGTSGHPLDISRSQSGGSALSVNDASDRVSGALGSTKPTQSSSSQNMVDECSAGLPQSSGSQSMVGDDGETLYEDVDSTSLPQSSGSQSLSDGRVSRQTSQTTQSEQSTPEDAEVIASAPQSTKADPTEDDTGTSNPPSQAVNKEKVSSGTTTSTPVIDGSSATSNEVTTGSGSSRMPTKRGSRIYRRMDTRAKTGQKQAAMLHEASGHPPEAKSKVAVGHTGSENDGGYESPMPPSSDIDKSVDTLNDDGEPAIVIFKKTAKYLSQSIFKYQKLRPGKGSDKTMKGMRDLVKDLDTLIQSIETGDTNSAVNKSGPLPTGGKSEARIPSALEDEDYVNVKKRSPAPRFLLGPQCYTSHRSSGHPPRKSEATTASQQSKIGPDGIPVDGGTLPDAGHSGDAATSDSDDVKTNEKSLTGLVPSADPSTGK